MTIHKKIKDRKANIWYWWITTHYLLPYLPNTLTKNLLIKITKNRRKGNHGKISKNIFLNPILEVVPGEKC